nr:hypothetical protein CFP56_60356 [Quercus suber]
MAATELIIKEQVSLQERRDREGVEVKSGRPLGTTSSVGSFSCIARRHARACASKIIVSTSIGAVSSLGGSGGKASHLSFPFLPLVAVVD